MSSAGAFCFVEGVDNDKYFYSQIASPIFFKRDIKVEYSTANELNTSGMHGGKVALTQFFHYLKSTGMLSNSFKGKKTTFAFFFDKDVDEFENKTIVSKHVFYTEHYDLQNYLFVHGDVINSAAARASIPLESVSHTLGDISSWLNYCIDAWKEWVTICLFLKVKEISHAGYGVLSKVNTRNFGPLDTDLLAVYKAQIQRKSGLTEDEFDMEYSKMEASVNEIFAEGHANRIFKGKWYLNWLANHLESKHSVTVDIKSLACVLASNLDWNGKWVGRYKTKLTRLVSEHLE